MSEREEEKNKRIALVTSIGVHALLLVIFLFAVAWRAPDPPLPEYGIELNFGLDDQGSGDIQPTEPAGSQQPAEDEVEQSQSEESQDEVNQEPTQESQPAVEPPSEKPVVTKQESPVAVKEEKKTETKPVEKPKEQPKETVKTETKPKEATVQQKTTSTADKTTSDNKEGKPVSQGDDANKTGDKGKPEGSPDPNAMYDGKPGGGQGGDGLDLKGWDWDEIPIPDIPDNEMPGRIVFKIKVNDQGELVEYKKDSGSVSAAAEKACREAIEKLTFSKKPGAIVPKITEGTITFVIRSN
jgi:outer membrane biosynthesis protein TonB